MASKKKKTLLPTLNIGILAEYAVVENKKGKKGKKKKAFRKALTKPGNFSAAFDDELKGDGAGTLNDLNPTERRFCEGWIYLATEQYEYGGLLFDKRLVKAIKKHIKESKVGPLAP